MELAFAVSQNGVHSAVLTQSIIANNLANLNTDAFKALRSAPGTFKVPGTQIIDAVPDPAEGAIRQTERELDLAIAGDGYFILETDTGRAFTRAGNFHVDQDGNIVTAAGYLLEANLTLPDEATGLTVSPEGRAYARFQDGTSSEIGQLDIARFRNSAGLLPLGDNIYVEGPNSGDAITLTPGEEGAGLIKQSYLERSNVDEATEITNQIINQRFFQASVKTFQVMNELVGTAIDLVR